MGPVTVTNDAKTAIDAVNELKATGGGDCPELAMTGLYEALLRSLPESTIYLFTDADAKDGQRRKEVMSLASENKIKVNFVLTGTCSRRKKRHIQQSFIFRRLNRSKRNGQGQTLYQAIASQTGGQVLETSKAGIADAVKVIDGGVSGKSGVSLRKVELLDIRESRAQYFGGHSFYVDIDSTLESLVLILTAAGSPSLDVKPVEGNEATTVSKVFTTTKPFNRKVSVAGQSFFFCCYFCYLTAYLRQS